jgi:hypothetical protein
MRNLALRDGERGASEQQRTDAERAENEETGVREQGKKEVGHEGDTGRAGNYDDNRTSPQDLPAQDEQHQGSVSKGRDNMHQTNPFRTNYAPLRNQPPTVTPPHNPLAGQQRFPMLSHIHSPNGHFKLTSIAGDQNFTDSSQHTVNTNSGNTTTTTTTNSNNDSSLRISTGS